MSLASTKIDRESSPIWASHAFIASTTRSAVTMPPGVWTRGGRERSSRVMGERSKIRTPRSSATRRSPRASKRGLHGGPGLARALRRGGRRPGAARDLLRLEPFEDLLAVALDGGDGLLPGADLRSARGRPQPAVVAKVRVDAVRGAESADRLDGPCRGAAEPERLVGSDDVLELRELRPPGKHEAAVAPARTAAADVALDEHDVERRVVLLERIAVHRPV